MRSRRSLRPSARSVLTGPAMLAVQPARARVNSSARLGPDTLTAHSPAVTEGGCRGRRGHRRDGGAGEPLRRWPPAPQGPDRRRCSSTAGGCGPTPTAAHQAMGRPVAGSTPRPCPGSAGPGARPGAAYLRRVRRLGGPVPRRGRERPGGPGRRPLVRRRGGHRLRPRQPGRVPARCCWPTPSAARPGPLPQRGPHHDPAPGLGLGTALRRPTCCTRPRLVRLLPTLLEDFIPNLVQNPLGMFRTGEFIRRADLVGELRAVAERGTPVSVAGRTGTGWCPGRPSTSCVGGRGARGWWSRGPTPGSSPTRSGSGSWPSRAGRLRLPSPGARTSEPPSGSHATRRSLHRMSRPPPRRRHRDPGA